MIRQKNWLVEFLPDVATAYCVGRIRQTLVYADPQNREAIWVVGQSGVVRLLELRLCPAKRALLLTAFHFTPFPSQRTVLTCYVCRCQHMSTKSGYTWRMPSSGMWRRVTFIRTDVLGEHIASFIKVKRISELGTMLVVTGNWSTLWWIRYVPPKRRSSQRASVASYCRFLSPCWCRRCVPLKLRFLQEPNG
jgi:hypothetical protein